jgi:RNase P/RNase MRP subunit p29
VVSSSDGSLLNLKGLVVDETKNMLVVAKSCDKRLMISKSILTLNLIDRRGEKHLIQGKILVGSPAERIKG